MSDPVCKSDNRCIICSECEARIVERQKEKDARVADGYSDAVSGSEIPRTLVGVTAKAIAQAIRESS